MNPENKSKPKVLYVDDEVHNLTAFRANFRRDFEIFTAESGEEGLRILTAEWPEVVVTDQRMPQMTGIEFLMKVQAITNAPIRLLLTGYSDINAVIDAINKGQVYRYLTKPWNDDELRNAVLSAHELFELRKHNAELLKALERANDQLEFLLRQKLLS